MFVTLQIAFAEILQPDNEKNIIWGCLYKSPNVKIEIFNEEINRVLGKIGFKNKLCFW